MGTKFLPWLISFITDPKHFITLQKVMMPDAIPQYSVHTKRFTSFPKELEIFTSTNNKHSLGKEHQITQHIGEPPLLGMLELIINCLIPTITLPLHYQLLIKTNLPVLGNAHSLDKFFYF